MKLQPNLTFDYADIPFNIERIKLKRPKTGFAPDSKTRFQFSMVWAS